MEERDQFFLELSDGEWRMDYIDHDRIIARAIVFDAKGNYYFVRAQRDDDFGNAVSIESAGGGVEAGESPDTAILRELREELGVKAEVLCRLGVVSDYYNLIHRHNLNNYYLCRALSFGERALTEAETKQFRLSTLKLSYDEAIEEYQRCRRFPIGRLLANRELPVLKHAKPLVDSALAELRKSEKG